MSPFKPFQVNVSDVQLKDLKERLAKTLFPSEIKEHGLKAGPTVAFLKSLTDELQNNYDWKKHEAIINRYPQFVTEIDGQTIHFLHVESKIKEARPLMLIHGWPGSFVEFLDVIEPLTNPIKYGGKAEDAFHLVIPSIPGFGFSGPTKEAGWNNDRIAAAFHTLMQNLGYTKYGVQGGDAGAVIAPAMGRLAPDHVTGIHVNAATLGFIPMGPVGESDLATMTDQEKIRMQRMQKFMQERFAFNMLQSTRPQSLAFAITDSPAGLLAWMSELFTEFGEKPEMIQKEKFLTNFMIYWLTGTAASSIRLYFENANDPNAWAPKENSGVPTGVAVFQKADIAIRRFAEQGNTIARWTEFDKGNHFPAMEVPEILVQDIRSFFAGLKEQSGEVGFVGRFSERQVDVSPTVR